MNSAANETLYRIALTLLPNVGFVLAKNLIAYCGSASEVFKASKGKLEKIPLIGEERARGIVEADVMAEAEAELKFIEEYGITPLFFTDAEYPQRLKECNDSPMVLYYKGNANLNADKVVAIVGTRRATEYGKEVTKKLVQGLSEQGVLVVSGLAYGIDGVAHQTALENGVNTVGVLGHGLNTLYPAQHKNMAKKMIEQGGLLTEYRSTEEMKPHNFPNRNRIVAGMSDAVIVIESAADGGALLTANLAHGYNRDVFAYPGRTTDKFSAGCNLLVKSNKATLIENVNDFWSAMNWLPGDADAKPKFQQRQLALNLSAEEKAIFDVLNEKGESDIDTLTALCEINSGSLAVTLLEMEMNGLLVALPGKRYKLL
ncbi:MAG: DNA-processing protein DprA [Chitinophagales bacterium]